MSLLKIASMTCSGFILWLAPPFILSRKIPLHNMTTGLALISSFACCFEARRVAFKVSQAEDFEAMKLRAVNDDVEDELATSAYISEQQRRIEAEQILNAGSKDVEHLERALALTRNEGEHSECSEHEESHQLAKIDSERSVNTENERTDRILELRAKGWGKLKIILEIWGLTRGGGAKYKAAEAEYKRLVEDDRESEE